MSQGTDDPIIAGLTDPVDGGDSALCGLQAVTLCKPFEGWTEKITLPVVKADKTCWDVCRERAAAEEQKCNMMRKQVQQWLEDQGCKSVVRAYKKPSYTAKKRTVSKKKKASCSSCSRR